MSAGFRAVQWNRDKLVYDAILIAGVALFLTGFVAIGWRWHPPKDYPAAIDLLIRATGSCAFLMLTIILCIGPLARLDRRLLPLLYNRRHFGVLTFLIALTHAGLMVEWFAAQNALPDLLAEMTSLKHYDKFIGFPFKMLGLSALLVLLVMAVTSHDFWLAFLTPRAWKAIHMLLYGAYGLVVMHVALGIMQYERTLLIPLMLYGGFATVTALHLIAGFRERANERRLTRPASSGWIVVGAPKDIPDRAARIVATPSGERIAVFRDGDEIGALTNLCAHQHGPLGEGRIIDGCITCPWHGYQYRLADGRAPPPFTERLVTYRVRLNRGIVEVDSKPLPPGTPASIRIASLSAAIPDAAEAAIRNP